MLTSKLFKNWCFNLTNASLSLGHSPKIPLLNSSFYSCHCQVLELVHKTEFLIQEAGKISLCIHRDFIVLCNNKRTCKMVCHTCFARNKISYRTKGFSALFFSVERFIERPQSSQRFIERPQSSAPRHARLQLLLAECRCREELLTHRILYHSNMLPAKQRQFKHGLNVGVFGDRELT